MTEIEKLRRRCERLQKQINLERQISNKRFEPTSEPKRLLTQPGASRQR